MEKKKLSMIINRELLSKIDGLSNDEIYSIYKDIKNKDKLIFDLIIKYNKLILDLYDYIKNMDYIIYNNEIYKESQK